MNAHFDIVDAVRFARVNGAWGAREDRLLRQLFPHQSWSALLQALPHRSKRAIEQRASLLGISRYAKRKPAWTTREEHSLRRLFSTAPWNELIVALPRHSKSAISQRGTQLGLRRPARTKLKPRYALLTALRAARLDARMTRPALAELIGVSRVQLERWELGLNVPRLPMLFDWSQALGLTIELKREGSI